VNLHIEGVHIHPSAVLKVDLSVVSTAVTLPLS
jgi:hypothetical protein